MKQNGMRAVYGMNKNILPLELDRPGFCMEPLFNMYKEISDLSVTCKKWLIKNV